MNKDREKILLHWLRSQKTKRINGYLYLSHILALINAIIIVAQAWLLASLLQALIVDNTPRNMLTNTFLTLGLLFLLRAVINYAHEKTGFIVGSLLRRQIRDQVLDHLARLGPAWIYKKPTGKWNSILLEQIEDMHDFYAHYLPQISLAVLIPIIILIVIFPTDWFAGLILFLIAPLIPLCMALVGMGASEANRRNFLALEHLSGYFLDRLRGLETLRVFFRAEAEIKELHNAAESFRQRTMEVLRLVFLSSSILELLASIATTMTAIYFSFSYLGKLHFNDFGTDITLFSGFLVLILTPEFFQPLRDLGKYYHAKAKAIGAAESLLSFLEVSPQNNNIGNKILPPGAISLFARDLWVLAPDGTELAGPLNFSLLAGQRVGIVGVSGSGKSSLFNVLLGFLPYRGSLLINGYELRNLSPNLWRERLSWVSQNSTLPALTLRDNILLGKKTATEKQLMQVIKDTYVEEFLSILPKRLDTVIGEDAAFLSAGQARRVVLARALMRTADLMLLDEPTASLDIHSEQLIMHALKNATRRQTTLLITHQLQAIADFDIIWVMHKGTISQQGHYKDLITNQGPLASFIASQAKEL